MQDKIIINTISRIYVLILSIVVFISLTFFILFIALQNGFHIESFSISKFQMKQVYIKWNENIDISMEKLRIIEKNNANANISINEVSQILQEVPNYLDIFGNITINSITYKDFSTSLEYVKGKDSNIIFSSGKYYLNTSFSFNEKVLEIQINQFKDILNDINLEGSLIVDPQNKNITTSFFVNIQENARVQILSYMNPDKVYYQINSLQTLYSIDNLIKQLHLDKELNYWVNDAITFSTLSIDSAYGWFAFSDIKNAYKNIYVKATANDLKYKYNKKLDFIHTKKTELIFEDGKLRIYPKEAYTYESKLQKSWVNIDFTKKEELLSIHLLFNGQLNSNTLNILRTYNIKLPFIQTTGNTIVDLLLDINLENFKVNSTGLFKVSKANINYLKYNIDVDNASIYLNNNKVYADNIQVKYKNIFTSSLDFNYDINNSTAAIDFRISKLSLKDKKINLHNKTNVLKARYILNKENSSLSIDKSSWKLTNTFVDIEKITFPFNLNTLKIKLPKTSVHIEKHAKGNFYGYLDLKNRTLNTNLILKKLYYKDIELAQDNLNIEIVYENEWVLNTHKKTNFTYKNKKSFLAPTNLVYKNKTFTLTETYINLSDFIKTKISASYITSTKKGSIQLRRTRINSEKLGSLYFNKNTTDFKIFTTKENILKVISKDINLVFEQSKDNWKLQIDSLNNLALNSKILDDYHLQDTSINLEKTIQNPYVSIDAAITYPYPILVLKNKKIFKYKIKGTLNTGSNNIALTINDNINMYIDNDIDITLSKLGINVNAIIAIKNSLPTTKEKGSTSTFNVAINAYNSYLYISNDRHAISDYMYLYYQNSILTAGLTFKDGVSGFKYEDSKFNAYGNNFDDTFMNQLFSMSKYQGGKLNFTLSGNTEEYNGLFTLTDSTIKDYKVINNILAFVNTLPSLVTFSVPQYSTEGLYVKDAYVKLKSKENIFTISDIYLNSQELKILGKGTASFKYNTVDLNLNLRTDVGSSVSKIPLVGYLLFDGQCLSSSLTVKGALDNPEVKTKIAQDIIISPLNLLLRAIALPYYLINIGNKETSIESKN